MFIYGLISSVLFFVMCSNIGMAESTSGSFIPLQFGNIVSISWPKEWENIDGRTNKLINTATESQLKLAGIDTNWNENKILISSNYRSNNGERIASLRLSVKPDKSIPKQDMKTLKSFTKKELVEAFSELLKETEKIMMKIEGVKSVCQTIRTIVAFKTMFSVRFRKLVIREVGDDGGLGLVMQRIA
jgi:hypothetical protein